VPVWHERTKQWVAEGKLVVLGVAEEQHPDRCRLFMQWHRIDWPMMHDPITKLGLTAVPVITAIDEHGIVRLTRPDPATFEQEFLNRTFGGERREARGESPNRRSLSPDLQALKSRAEAGNSAADWRAYGDAALLWGGPSGLQTALAAYERAVRIDPQEGSNHFRLGVAFRMRYDSPARQEGDFQAALDAWGRALALNPNQYIWRRRIQQYGPRLEKPYPFYGWIEEARAAIRARGDTPLSLTAEPTGAEIAAPLRTLDAAAPAAEPDPEGRITRDRGEFIRVEVAVAPGQAKAGSPVRLHLVFRPVQERQAHWNNEAEPLRVWLRLPKGWEAEQRLIELPQPRTATSDEVRETSTELRPPAGTPPGPVELTGYALYNVCEGASGTCLFRRQDIRVRIEVS
jgi:tetratricopeptide (TPR) repeat protein